MLRRRDNHSALLYSVRTSTVDGVLLRGLHLPGPDESSTQPLPPVFVVCHGMTNATAKISTRAALDRLAHFGPVVAFDFRGHGRSGGRSTVGLDEVLDVDAAISFAREHHPRPVVLVGFSMGGACVLRQQGTVSPVQTVGAVGVGLANGNTDARLTQRADAVVSVSAPARWFLRESRSMLRVQWLLEHPAGKLVGPRLGIRLGQAWSTVPSTPLATVAAIAPTPLLIVHGSDDHYFSPAQAEMLHRAAPGSDLWLIDRMGHAESGISADTLDRIAHWAVDRINS